MWKWIIGGISTDDNKMDDARIHAGIGFMAILVLAGYCAYNTPAHDIKDAGEFIKNVCFGLAAYCTGIGAWFGIRGKN